MAAEQAWTDQHGPRLRRIGDVVDDRVDRDDKLVEVGSKPWVLAEEIVTEVEYHALNLTVEQFTVQAGGHHITNHKCNIETGTWPFADDSVDCVVMGAVLEHLTDPAAALREARRVLASDGVLVLTTPNALRLIQRARVILGRNPWDGYDANGNQYHRHNREWTPEEVRALLQGVGFGPVDIETTTLQRAGALGTMYESVAGLRQSWDDDILAVAAPLGSPSDNVPGYRQALTDRVS